MEESEEIEIMKKNQVEILEIKTSINQVQTTVDRQDQTEERLSEMEDKIEELFQANNHKEKKLMHINTTDKNSRT
jgi:hypothetical protein